MKCESSDSLQQDFEFLEVDSIIPNESTLGSDNVTRDSTVKNVSSEANQFLDQSLSTAVLGVDMCFDESLTSESAMSSSSDFVQGHLPPSMFEQSREPSSAAEKSNANQRSAEPIRTQMYSSSSAGRPKRFFRTFWRGITTRAVAMDSKKNTIPA